MDIGYLKVRIDISSEHDSYKKKYDYRRKELKKEEIKKIFEGFKDFFRTDGNFKFRDNEHSVTAEYKDHAIKLDIDVYKNIDSPDFYIEGTIKTFDKDSYVFFAEGICNKDMSLQPANSDEHERMILDTRFYKDFLEGEISYTFRYKIMGRDGEYNSMQELMFAL